ncbi:lipopolysaccharide assembly protein LapB [Lacinutrix sp. Bg11-31]|uniref:tetratricopeptide repeat protein n=1 Tax=Lacinutrix sp. Bg11-31 TaxID=2057808 RepID=UPI000C308914|nr:tetratricopeptide repeat protein [Lacinutrix sp. Bg11-31]AUC80812.1 hypothetical protein CW733_01135 [Lacinutrix sp. Bg11-31]
MNKIIIIVLIGLTSLVGYTQEDFTNTIKTLYENKQYDKIISEYSGNVKNYSAKAVYYVGMTYYSKSDYNNFLKLIDLSIKKDKTDPDTFFSKGVYYNYKRKFSTAIKLLKKAIKLNPNESSYLGALGNSYCFLGRSDKALSLYKSAIKKENPPDYIFTQIPLVYLMKNDIKNAIKSFYIAKDNISKDSESYINLIKNIANHELLSKEYDKALIAFKELNELRPKGFGYYSEIIQVYYAKKEYKKAETYKQRLYENYSKDTLNVYRKKWFCLDKFIWKDKRVHAMEYFAVKENKYFYKHVFYVLNENGKAKITIQMENAPNPVKSGEPKYNLGMEINGTHTSLPYKFDENFDYDELKKTVIQVLNEKVNADLSSRR